MRQKQERDARELDFGNAGSSYIAIRQGAECDREYYRTPGAQEEMSDWIWILWCVLGLALIVTEVTMVIFKHLRREFGLNDVGIVLQSYLRRTYADAQDLLKIPARIRICKGAYNEPPEVAFPDKKDTDENYIRVMQLLLSSGVYHGIATHDPKMIDATIEFAQREGIGKEAFEFQMLYGVRRDLQHQLADDGYNMRVYVPYGKHWYPYFMRRLAERPANIWFVLKNLFKG